ncbi:hypothetical protein FACS189430_07600 [Bacteroidia bacterium]|nr:hypothetical protein FACS189430_07600 [Bacteroidia bacterium]
MEETRVSVFLKSSTDEIEFLNDTVRKVENILNISSKVEDYILFVEFENKTIGKEALNYPFSLIGNETDIEINVRFWKQSTSFDKKKKDNGSIEIIKYYEPNHYIEIKYLPKMKGYEYYKAPFFMLKNNSTDTIYGRYIKDYFWGSISFLVDSIWSRDYFGQLDTNFAGGSPLFPDSLTVAWVGSFGWRNKLPKNRYKYTLLYTTDKNIRSGGRQYLENDNFVWWADTKKYYRLIYEFDAE